MDSVMKGEKAGRENAQGDELKKSMIKGRTTKIVKTH